VPFTGHLSYTSVHRAGGPSGGYKATLQRGGWYGIDSGGPPSSSVVTGYDYRSNCAIETDIRIPTRHTNDITHRKQICYQ